MNMHKYLLILMILLPLLAAAASPDQTPSFDPLSGSFGFPSEDFGSGSSYLGVDTRDITPDRVSALKLKNESGVEVTMVDQDAPAGRAGIKEHDVILTVNGNKVESVEQLRRMIREIPAGRTVDIGVSRNGQPMKLQAQLAERHANRAMKFNMPSMPAMPAMPNMSDFDVPVSVVVVHSSMRSGLMVENLTPQLGDYFGAKNGHGVLVRSVEKGSRAEKAGFRAGDVIVRVGKDPVHDSGDFNHALQSHRSTGSVAVGIIRDKKEQNITLTLPPRRESGELFPEESFEVPDVEIDARAELSDIKTEMARLQPQIELAIRESRRHIEKAQRDAEQLKKQICSEQKKQMSEMQKQQEELRRQVREQTSRIREKWNSEWKKNWEEQQKELRRELRELQENAAEI
jgi:serine protease Do